MRISEIKKEPNIYQEMDKWIGGKGPVTPEEVRRRELILLKQVTLYKLEDAILLRDKHTEAFFLEMLETINRYLKDYG